MQKAMENSCYFYTADKIKHHLSDLHFAKVVEGNKSQGVRNLKDPSVTPKYRAYRVTNGKRRHWTMGNEA